MKEKEMNRKKYGLTVICGLLAGFSGGITAFGFFVGGPAFAEKVIKPKKVVMAEEFRLVDKDGEVLSTWGSYAGNYGMVFYSKEGEYRALFSLTSPEGAPVLTLADKKGRYRTLIGLGTGRQPYIALRDKDGKERLSLTLTDTGEPTLIFYDNNGKERAVLGTMDITRMKRTGAIEERSYSSLVLFDQDGKIVWKAP
jgi:hypothetical protein